ncbi:MAG: OprO/OprP family phosphate-selective porin [Panacagrimonas sp.]
MSFEGSFKATGFRLGAGRIAQGVLVAAFLGAPLAASAAPSTEDLDQRIKILERQLEIQKEEADAKAKDASTTTVGDKGLSVKKGDFEIRLKGLVQADFRSYLDDFNPANTVITPTTNRGGLYSNDSTLFRRIRPTFEGTFGKLVGFRLTPEFAGNGSGEASSIVDAYIDLKFSPAATLRAGKVKGPVGLERLQSGGSINFIERGFPTELAPNRDLGVQFQGELFGSTVNYTLGYYNGTPDGRDITGTDVDDSKEVGARLFFEPFKNGPGFFQGLGFGVGSSFGSKEQGAFNAANANSFLPRYRTPGQIQFFSYRGVTAATGGTTPSVNGVPTPTAGTAGSTGVFADGDHVRLSPQLYFYRNSFGLLGEYISSEQELSQGFIPGGALPVAPATTTTGATAPSAFASKKLENTAWQVVATFVLTGEDASYRGVVKPTTPFTLGGPGWGALEVAARYGKLEIDDEAFDTVAIDGVTVASFASATSNASEAETWTLGFNWYLTSNVKAVVNYTQTEFEGGGGGTSAAPLDREDEKAVFGRIQLSF